MTTDNTLVFRIKTAPDAELGRRLFGLRGLDDTDVIRVMHTKQRETNGGGDMLPLHWQRIVAISVLYRDDTGMKVWSLGDETDDEKHLLQHFFTGIERYRPRLVSWNGCCFDMPVIHYRALKYGIASRTYWEAGQHDEDFRDNHYHGRFHDRHTDLQDMLSGHQRPGQAPLDEIAALLHLPNRADDATARHDGITEIRHHCECEVLNIWLIYLHWLHLTTMLADAGLANERLIVQEALLQANQPHLTEYLKSWNEQNG